MFELISTISAWALGVIEQGGYPGIFFLSILDRVALNFVPAEYIFPLIGFLASQGEINLILGVAFTVIGGFVGDVIVYQVSLKGGRPLVERFGKYFLFSKHDLDHTEKLFQNHGSKIIFWGRFIPVFVAFISIPAGITRMNFKKFSIYTILSSIPRNFLIIYAGFKAGQNWPATLVYLERFDFVIIILLIAAIVWYIYRHLKKRHATHK